MTDREKPKSRLSRPSLGKKGARGLKNKGKRKAKKLGFIGKVKSKSLGSSGKVKAPFLGFSGTMKGKRLQRSSKNSFKYPLGNSRSNKEGI